MSRQERVQEVQAKEAEQVKKQPIWLGGAAAMMAVTITHPIDQTKIRSQTQKIRLSMLQTMRNTVNIGGVTGLWAGLTGSWLRQATYGAARFGIYDILKKETIRRTGKQKPDRWMLVANGAVAGVIAGIVGAPGELVMVRMSADALKPPEHQFKYRNAIQGLWKITRDEGISKVFRGCGPTILRSVIMNASQLSCYDVIKEQLLASGYFVDSTPTHLLTAVLGGTIAVTLVAPVDVIKSRVQSSTRYEPISKIVSDALRKEGPRVFFRGWVPAWWRMTPTTALTFAFYEQLKKLF